MRPRRLVLPATLIVIALVAWHYGVEVRRWAWDSTSDIRFTGDIANGWNWGGRADRRGVVHIYDHLLEKNGESGRFGLDYLPLRLYVMTRWHQWAAEKFPDQTQWQNTWEFNAPLLWLNTLVVAAASVGTFFLVRLWRRRWAISRRPPPPAPPPSLTGRLPTPAPPLPASVGCAAGMAAALLMWFNPAIIWETHCWPQWDIWLLPFFIFALLAVSCEWWITAGVLLGVGTLTKGQLLFVAPLLVAFPLLMGKVTATLRMIGGLALGSGVALWAFFLRDDMAWWWLGMYTLAMAGLVPWGVLRKWRWLALMVLPITTAAAMALMVWTWVWHGEALVMLGCAAYLLASAVIARRRGWRAVTICFFAGLGPAIWLAGWKLGGSFSWLMVGVEYGTRQYATMHMGPTVNLAAILQDRMGWEIGDPACAFDLPSWLPWLGGQYQWTIRDLLIRVFILSGVFCVIAAAKQYRARSPRFLIAAIAPWLLAYLILPQMHERYLIWIAAASAVLAVFSPVQLLIHLFLTALAWGMMAMTMFNMNESFAPKTHQFLQQITPDIGWALLVVGAVMLHQMFGRDPGPVVESRAKR